LQSLDPEIDAQIKARYRDKFKLDSDVQPRHKPAVSSFIFVCCFYMLPSLSHFY